MELKQIKIYANQNVHLSSSLACRGVRLMLRMNEWPLPSPTFVPSRGGVYSVYGLCNAPGGRWWVLAEVSAIRHIKSPFCIILGVYGGWRMADADSTYSEYI